MQSLAKTLAGRNMVSLPVCACSELVCGFDRLGMTGSVFGKKKPYKIIISLFSADDIIETHEFTGSFYKFQHFS